MKPSNNMPQKVLFKVFFAIYTRENGDSKNNLRYSQFMQKNDLIGQGDMSISPLRIGEEWYGLMNAQLSEAKGYGQFGHGIHLPNSLKCRIFIQFRLESQLSRCFGLALAIIRGLDWLHWMGSLILDILVLPAQSYLIFISHIYQILSILVISLCMIMHQCIQQLLYRQY